METTATHKDKEMERAVIGGSSTEALAGAAALILAILGLAHIAPSFMVAVATIALGGALILDGAAITAEYSRVLADSGSTVMHNTELGGGVGAQISGGIAAVVLGVLALLGIDPVVLTAVAAIVLGAATMSSSGLWVRLNALKVETSGGHDLAKRVARDALSATAGTDVLVGLAAIVLGILALVGLGAATLTLVAMIALGAAVLLTGSAVIGKMLSIFTV